MKRLKLCSRSLLASLPVLVLLSAGCGGKSSSLNQPGGQPPAASAADISQQLTALPAPQEVDPQLFVELKSALEQQLQQQFAEDPGFLSRTAQAAPTGEGLKIRDLRLIDDGVSQRLEWSLVNEGDYDQNGEVAISDLTPLGINFGATDPGGGRRPFDLLDGAVFEPFGFATALSVVDGDSNGEVNMSDITPIAVGFGSWVSGYNVYAAADYSDFPATDAAPSTLTPVGGVLLADAAGDVNADRLQFSFELPPESSGLTYWVRPLNGIGEGIPSNPAGEPFSYPPGSQSFVEISPASTEPGEVVTILFTQPLNGQLDDIMLTLEPDIEYPLSAISVTSSTEAFFIAPLLVPGIYDYSLTMDGEGIGTFQLEILAAETDLTPEVLEQLQTAADEGLKLIADPDHFPDFFDFARQSQIDPIALEAELGKFDELFMVLHAWLADELAQLEPEDQQQVLAYLENVGYTDIQEALSLNAMQASRAASKVTFHPWYGSSFEALYYDAVSAKITNSGLFRDLASFSLGIVAGPAGFAVAAASFTAGLQGAIIDLVYPTDLGALSNDMDRNGLIAQQDYELRVWGNFFSQDAPTPGQTLEALITNIIGAAPLPSLVEAAVLDAFAGWVVATGANLGVSLALETVLPTIENPEDPFAGHVSGGWQALDPYLYKDDTPAAIYAKLGLAETNDLESAFSYYKQHQPEFLDTFDAGEFISSVGGAVLFEQQDQGHAAIRLPAEGRTTLFFRAFSFKSTSLAYFWEHSYPELVSCTADFWVGRDTDWQSFEVFTEEDGGQLEVPRDWFDADMLMVSGYPYVLAKLDPASDVPFYIQASFQSGAGWDAPVSLPGSLSSETGISLGLFEDHPVAVVGTYLLISDNQSGTAWPGAWEFHGMNSGFGDNDRLVYAHKSVDEETEQPALLGLGKRHAARVYKREEISHNWNFEGWNDLTAHDDSCSTLIDGRPATVYWDDGLYYRYAADELGQAWNAPVLIPGTVGTGGEIWEFNGLRMVQVSLQNLNGDPAILLRGINWDNSHQALYLLKGNGSEGLNWSAPITVYDVPDWQRIGVYIYDLHRHCFAMVGGRPAVMFTEQLYVTRGGTYYEGTVLMYAQALDASGETWGDPVPVSSQVGYTRLYALVDNVGNPGILAAEGNQLTYFTP